jgi:hypothetical protein
MDQQHDVERRLLEATCLELDIDPGLVDILVALERDNERRLRRRGLFPALRSIIEDYVTEHEHDSS